MSNKLSVTIVTYNSEKTIEGCLKSVNWADEVIVVDSGSSDNTVDIARKYTDKIFLQEWMGHKEQKNFAIDKTSYDWIFSIDSDEVCPEKLKNKIIEILKNPKYDGYRFPRKNYFANKWMRFGGWYPDYQLRLFKKSCGRFEGGNAHEKVKINGKVKTVNIPLIHYTYDSLVEYLEKQNKYTTLIAQQVSIPPLINQLMKLGILFYIFFLIYLLIRFILKIFEIFIYKLGFLDGYWGIIVGFIRCFFSVIKDVKIIEKYRSATL